ncbi:MAG: hypothetical protein U0Z44_16235 [Kouleothrix sp.]
MDGLQLGAAVRRLGAGRPAGRSISCWAFLALSAYDGNRNDAATRDFALALLDPSLSPAERARKLHDQRDANGQLLRAGACLYRQADPALLAALARPVTRITQYQRQQLMSREGMCLIAARPLAFVQKSLAELIDLFQINPTGAERFMSKFSSGRLPPWYPLALFALDDTLYVLVLPLAVLGWALLRRLPGRSLQALIGLWWLYNLAVAPLLFVINRFRLPLLPFAFQARGLRAQRCRVASGAAAARLRLVMALAALLLLVVAHALRLPRAARARRRLALGLHRAIPSSLDITSARWATARATCAPSRPARRSRLAGSTTRAHCWRRPVDRPRRRGRRRRAYDRRRAARWAGWRPGRPAARLPRSPIVASRMSRRRWRWAICCAAAISPGRASCSARHSSTTITRSNGPGVAAAGAHPEQQPRHRRQPRPGLHQRLLPGRGRPAGPGQLPLVQRRRAHPLPTGRHRHAPAAAPARRRSRLGRLRRRAAYSPGSCE